MAQNAPVADKGSNQVKRPPVLPEERFWKRYSPHHEMTLSATASFLLHCLGGLALIVLAVYLIPMLQQDKPPPIDLVVVDPMGGGPSGPVGPGEPAPPPRTEAAVANQNDPPPEKPKVAVAPPLQKPEIPDVTSSSPLDEKIVVDDSDLKPLESVANIPRLNKDPSAVKGVAGSRPGGGDNGPGGPGVGDRTGPEVGKDNAKPTVQQKRRRRWDLHLDTSDIDYVKQLHSLNAIVAYPVDREHYFVIRDLKRPAEGTTETLDKLHGFPFVDDRSPSKNNLATGLGLNVAPDHFLVIFPGSLEKELLDMELRYLRMSRPGGREADISYTRFDLIPRPGGRFEPVVTRQILGAR